MLRHGLRRGVILVYPRVHGQVRRERRELLFAHVAIGILQNLKVKPQWAFASYVAVGATGSR